MEQYVFKLGEFRGSDFLEFRKGNTKAGKKFLRQDSLYVLDNAFFFFLEGIFQEVVASFDMFGDTYITREQWQEITRLSIPEIICPEFADEVKETASAIDRWIKEEAVEEFVVIGV